MSYTWIEPFAGAAAVALRLVGGRDLMPPVAWMGGKRRYARAIADAMGVPAARPGRVVLCDAGPWGWVWPLLLDQGCAHTVAGYLRDWSAEHPRELWDRLADSPPFSDVFESAAQWLWLQARSASGVPIWWDGWRFRQPDRTAPTSTWKRFGDHNAGRWMASDGRGVPRAAGQRTLGGWQQGSAEGKQEDRDAGQQGRAQGMVFPTTLADRIESIAKAFAKVDWRVVNLSASDLPVRRWPDTWVYLDPPYVGATGYGWDCPRERVVELAQAWEHAGAVVAVSEAEPLELDGWHHLDLTRPGGKPEWLTLSREPARLPVTQRRLFGDAR